MTPRLSVFGLLLGTAMLAGNSVPAAAGIALPLRPIADRMAEQTAMDAIACVAGVLSFHTGVAKESCGRVVKAAPGEPLGYKYRGLAYLLEHDFEKAEEDFHAAVRLDPADAENQAGYAQSMSGQGRFAEAIAHFNEALQLKPDDVRFLAARCWARMGDGKDLELALTDCNKASDGAPDYATARLNRGMVRLKQQNYQAALQDFSRALDLDSDMPSGLFGRGFAYLQLKDGARAQADILAARKADPSIDNLFIRTGILPASCRDASAPCPLPPDLRNPAPSGLWLTSYQRSPDQRSSMDELDDAIRAMALDRLDGMLAGIAGRFNISLGADFMPRIGVPDTSGAGWHIMRVQQEYRRLQRIACRGANAQDRYCRAPNFQYTPMMRDDAVALRAEIERTTDIVQAFWLDICRRPAPGGRSCLIE